MAEIDRTVRDHLLRLVETWEEIGLENAAVRIWFAACQGHVNVSDHKTLFC